MAASALALFGMGDASALVFALHERSLRAICAASGEHYNDLSQAARDRSVGLSFRTRRRLMQIDAAFGLLRLVTSVSVDEFVNGLRDELYEYKYVNGLLDELLNAQAGGREAPAEAASAAAENEEQRVSAASAESAASEEERHMQQEWRRLRRLPGLGLQREGARDKGADANANDDFDGVDDELYGDGVDDAKRSSAGASSSTTAIVADAVHDDGGAVPQDADAAAGAQGPVVAAHKKRRRKLSGAQKRRRAAASGERSEAGVDQLPRDAGAVDESRFWRYDDERDAEPCFDDAAAHRAWSEAEKMQRLLALSQRPKCPQHHSLGAPRVSMCEARRCGVCGAEATVGMDCVGCDFAICFECVRDLNPVRI